MLFLLLPTLNPSGAEIGGFLGKHFLIEKIHFLLRCMDHVLWGPGSK